MAIIDEISINTNKTIVIQTLHGQVFVTKNFSIHEDQPIRGTVRIEDHSDGKVYWFNFDHIIWIGPR